MQSLTDNAVPAQHAPAEMIVTDEKAPFFSVSPAKLALMYFCTAGLYGTYWFYKNWELVKQRDDTEQDSLPMLRAGLATFLAFFLFRSMRATGRRVARFVVPVSPVFLAAGFFLTNVLSTVVGDVYPPAALLALFGFVFLTPVQQFANQVNATVDPDLPANDDLTIKNWLFIILLLPLVLFWIYIQVKAIF